jgi:hypothetical protein
MINLFTNSIATYITDYSTLLKDVLADVNLAGAISTASIILAVGGCTYILASYDVSGQLPGCLNYILGVTPLEIKIKKIAFSIRSLTKELADNSAQATRTLADLNESIYDSDEKVNLFIDEIDEIRKLLHEETHGRLTKHALEVNETMIPLQNAVVEMRKKVSFIEEKIKGIESHIQDSDPSSFLPNIPRGEYDYIGHSSIDPIIEVLKLTDTIVPVLFLSTIMWGTYILIVITPSVGFKVHDFLFGRKPIASDR